MIKSKNGYSVDGEEYTSVTIFIYNVIFEPFNSREVAERMVKYKKEAYLGMTVEEIMEQWDKGSDAARLGTLLHAHIEDYLNGEKIHPSPEVYDEFQQFREFYSDIKKDFKGIRVYQVEMSIYDPRKRIGGTLDCLMVRKGKYMLLDWKRSPMIEKGSFKFSEHEYFNTVKNTKMSGYNLQMNFYKQILKRNYNIDVEDRMFLISFWGPNGEHTATRVKEMEEVSIFFDSSATC